MIAAVDIGNTSIKVAYFQSGKLIDFARTQLNKQQEVFNSLSRNSSLSAIGISDVTGISDGWNVLELKAQVYRISSSIAVPFNIIYDSPFTLGSDRVCLAAGAIKKLESNEAALVISMGTCVTYEYISNNHDYLGGAISPGYLMRFEALHTLTKKLPLVKPSADIPLIGKNTISSLESGVYEGLRLELEGRIAQFLEANPLGKVFLTGGDAETFASALKNSIFADNFLLLKGINEIVEYQALHTSSST